MKKKTPTPAGRSGKKLSIDSYSLMASVVSSTPLACPQWRDTPEA